MNVLRKLLSWLIPALIVAGAWQIGISRGRHESAVINAAYYTQTGYLQGRTEMVRECSQTLDEVAASVQRVQDAAKGRALTRP